MTAAAAERPVVGTCQSCQQPVRAGDERWESTDHATAAVAEVLLHRRFCRPVNWRGSNL